MAGTSVRNWRRSAQVDVRCFRAMEAAERPRFVSRRSSPCCQTSAGSKRSAVHALVYRAPASLNLHDPQVRSAFAVGHRTPSATAERTEVRWPALGENGIVRPWPSRDSRSSWKRKTTRAGSPRCRVFPEWWRTGQLARKRRLRSRPWPCVSSPIGSSTANLCRRDSPLLGRVSHWPAARAKRVLAASVPTRRLEKFTRVFESFCSIFHATAGAAEASTRSRSVSSTSTPSR
jgi:hypothetical protein